MPAKNAAPSEKGIPKDQRVNRPDHKEAPPDPDDRKDPPRDTREAPVPNPNSEPVDKS